MKRNGSPGAIAVVAGVVVILLLATLAWQHLAVPWVEARIERATGHRTQVGVLRPRWRGLEARQVVLYGRPPFEAAPLARIERLTAELEGWTAPRPRLVRIEGALVTYLGIGLGKGAIDNVRGTSEKTAAPGDARVPLPRIEVHGGRLEAHVRLAGPGPHSVALRSDALELTRAEDGELRAVVGGAVVDVTGWLSVRLPRLEAQQAGGRLEIGARDLLATVPGGGALLAATQVALVRDGKGLRVEASAGATPAGVGRLSARLDWATAPRLTGTLALEEVSLAALQPLASRSEAGFTISRGRADLRATFAPPAEADRDIVDTISGALELAVRELDLHHPRLDRNPWRGLALTALAAGSGSWAARRLDVDNADVSTLGLVLRLSGQWSERPAPRLELRLAPGRAGPSACAQLLADWPAPVRERLDGLALAGQIGPRGRLAFAAPRWEALALAIDLAPSCTVSREPRALSDLWAARTAGTFPAALARLGVAAADYVRLGSLPRHVSGAFVTAEDAAFREHDGFHLEMVRRALAHNLAMGTLGKGASTLTQQLMKNLFLGPERTIGRKLAELVLTWRAEALLSKDDILELYLNAVELGPGLRGIGRAAQVYFGKPASALTPLEAAHLAAMLPNPVGFARRFRDGRVDEGWQNKLLDLLERMRRSGLIGAADLARARSAPLQLRRS